MLADRAAPCNMVHVDGRFLKVSHGAAVVAMQLKCFGSVQNQQMGRMASTGTGSIVGSLLDA